MTQKYKDEILNFLSCCLDVMFKHDDDVMLIEQNEPEIGKVYKSLKEYKANSDNFLGLRTCLSNESYKILYDNIVNWLEDIYPINVIRVIKDYSTRIRIQFNSENFNEDAIEMAIEHLKQKVKEEERRTMIDYIEDTAEKIINDFVRPCLGNMTNPDWEPDVIILPKKRNGLGYTFADLDCAKRHSIDDPDILTYDHGIDTDVVYKLIFDNMGQWVQDIPEIKVCYLKDGNLRIRFAEDTNLSDRIQAVQKLERTIEQNVNVGVVDERLPLIDEKYKEKKGEKRMNDFSLANLKDALVNKITHLDKKTITILALIALVLLVVGKYQDIKDILIGIKDKVKRSKNFKAMVADGTAAVDSLKKIVGVKDNKETTNEA